MNDNPFRQSDNSLSPETSFARPPADVPFVREGSARETQPYVPEAEFVRPQRRPGQPAVVPASTNPDASESHKASGGDTPVPFADKPPAADEGADEDPEQSATSSQPPAHAAAQRAVAETVDSLSEGKDEQLTSSVLRTAESPATERGPVDTAEVGEEPLATDRFAARYADGTVRPRDPFTGNILRPGEVPPSLLEDPGIQRGFKFWDEYGSEVAFKLLPTAHSKAEDLEEWKVNLRAEAERLGRAGGILFVEGDNAPQQNIQYLVDFFDQMSALPPEQKEAAEEWIQQQVDKGEVGSFYGGIGARILCTNTAVAVPDYHSDGTLPADTLLKAWNVQEKKVADMHRSGEITRLDREVKMGELFVGRTYTRDMLFVGRMGNHLADRHQPGRVSHASLLAGALHANVVSPLKDRNVHTTPVIPDLPDKSIGPAYNALLKMAGEARFNQAEFMRHLKIIRTIITL
jgi:hypothetical protein